MSSNVYTNTQLKAQLKTRAIRLRVGLREDVLETLILDEVASIVTKARLLYGAGAVNEAITKRQTVVNWSEAGICTNCGKIAAVKPTPWCKNCNDDFEGTKLSAEIELQMLLPTK